VRKHCSDGAEWPGVIIGFEIPIADATKIDVTDYNTENSKERLRKELGI
jgi:hypothetical protein